MGPLKTTVFESAHAWVNVLPPVDNRDILRTTADVLAKFPSAQDLSHFELRVAATEAGWDDFRWSMSHQDFLWHRWLLSTGQIYRCHIPANRVEAIVADDIEGLLIVSVGGAFFEWSAEKGATVGSVTFAQQNGPLDLDWVRRVCRSLEFVGPAPARGSIGGPADETDPAD
jgi:hypothetical protein